MICIGDSLTCGMVGHSYIEYSSSGEKIFNKGVNGDTTRCAYERLEKYLGKSEYDAQEIYVVAIGTNDILLPYLSRVSAAWKLETTLRCRIKKCIDDDEVFRREYEKYFESLRKRQKKIVTIGIPYIQLTDFPQDAVKRRNDIIKSLSEKYGAPYLDIYNMQLEAVRPQNPSMDEDKNEAIAKYTWKHKNIIRLLDNLGMLICPPVKDMLSHIRGLELTVDGVHYNSMSARLLGRALQEQVKNLN